MLFIINVVMFALFMGAEKIDRQNESAAPLTMLFLLVSVITYRETLYVDIAIQIMVYFLSESVLQRWRFECSTKASSFCVHRLCYKTMFSSTYTYVYDRCFVAYGYRKISLEWKPLIYFIIPFVKTTLLANVSYNVGA